jgi:hypothetical protein
MSRGKGAFVFSIVVVPPFIIRLRAFPRDPVESTSESPTREKRGKGAHGRDVGAKRETSRGGDWFATHLGEEWSKRRL